MWWQDSSGYNYYKRRSNEESFYPKYNRKKLLKDIKGSTKLTEYHKQQITKAIKQGLGGHIETDWNKFKNKKITSQDLILQVNKTMVEREIADDRIYFSSSDDFFKKF